MHIPDGYLSPQTSLPLLAAMVPVWSVAAGKVKKLFSMRQVPVLSLCAAFSFVIMMFNIPLGASSVHAVGAVFIAVLVGPWAASVAVSAALIIQALVFGDGGVLAIGANCFNMAFIMPMTGYYVYKLTAGKSEIPSKRGLAALFLGSYAGLNAAALLTALEFGIQPLLFITSDGVPQYGFYPLSVSVPAIMSEHLLAAGIAEGAVSAAAAAYIAKFSPALLNRARTGMQNPDGVKKGSFLSLKPFIIAIGALVALSPVGLIAGGTAWGEWGADEVRGMLGYVPEGLQKLSGMWKSLIPDYVIPGLGDGFFGSSAGYIISALLGVLVISVIMTVTSRLITRKEEGNG